MFVPVVDSNQNPLMPTSPSRARRWIKSRKATPFWKRGIFCVRLNIEPSNRNLSTIAIGIDPGSKKEGFTVKSKLHTYINIQADAIDWVKRVMEIRSSLRLYRRHRNTPYRKSRLNRKFGSRLPASIKARWQWKLRIVNWLCKMYPISAFVVEDIKATTHKYREAYAALGQANGSTKQYNIRFSSLQYGKNWFYSELKKLGRVETKQGYETFELRNKHGLSKSSNKLSEVFEAHCVDSWVLANWFTGGHVKPDNKEILFITPLRFHRRQLHVANPTKGGIRKRFGGMISIGFVKGSIVKFYKKSLGGKIHKGLAYVSGNAMGFVTLCNLASGKPSEVQFKPEHIKFLTYSSWRAHV